MPCRQRIVTENFLLIICLKHRQCRSETVEDPGWTLEEPLIALEGQENRYLLRPPFETCWSGIAGNPLNNMCVKLDVEEFLQ